MGLNARFIDVVDVAKLVRQSLKRVHAGVGFSVNSDRYSGGASVRVAWKGGPTQEEVEATVSQFKGARLDGDYSPRPAYHYLMPDGQAMVAFIEPSSAIGASEPQGVDNRMLASQMPPDVELVRFGADFVICQREPTVEEAAEGERQFAERRAMAGSDGLPF